MIPGEPDDQWPGPDDKRVVEEMLGDFASPHWEHCYNFIRRLVQVSGLALDHQDDTVQEVLLTVQRSLSGFRHEGKLRHWLGVVVYSHVQDVYRSQKREWWIMRIHDSPYDSSEASENASDHFEHDIGNSPPTPEEIYLEKEKWREIVTALQTYVNAHRDAERRCAMLQKVLFDGYTREAVAQQLGCSAAMVGYIVRAALRAVREQMRD